MSRRLRIVVAEDEAMVARRLVRLLRDILGGSGGSGGSVEIRTVDTLDAARNALTEQPADLLCLDLDLHGADGFRLLDEAAAGAHHTIVVSAHTHRAVEAFDHGVLDFVAKPFGRERLAQALARLRGPAERAARPLRYLGVRRAGRVDLIDIATVRSLEGAGSYTRIILRSGESMLHDKSLAKLEVLVPEDFERIHRSHLVRVSEIARFRALPGSRWEVELRDGMVLPVSRTRREALRARLG